MLLLLLLLSSSSTFYFSENTLGITEGVNSFNPSTNESSQYLFLSTTVEYIGCNGAMGWNIGSYGYSTLFAGRIACRNHEVSRRNETYHVTHSRLIKRQNICKRGVVKITLCLFI